MSDLSIFIDESGAADSKYYLLVLVFHNQVDDVYEPIRIYEDALRRKGLSDVPFHASPLMNGHDDYEHMDMETRKRIFSKRVRRQG